MFAKFLLVNCKPKQFIMLLNLLIFVRLGAS